MFGYEYHEAMKLCSNLMLKIEVTHARMHPQAL